MKIGIDPGNTGALALMEDNGGLIEVVDMPIMAMGKKNQVNPVELANILSNWKAMARMDNLKLFAYIEHVHSMPKQGVSSSFNFGMGYGVIQGVVAALKIPTKLIPSQTWKKYHCLTGKEKDNARTLALQQYPDASLARKKDIGRADAILIALYGCKN